MNYQLTILINNKLDEKKRADILDNVANSLGTNFKKDFWGVRGLAYPIKHEEKAYYAHFDFEVEPGLIPDIDRRLKLNEEIVRYLLIKVDPKVAAKAGRATAKAEVKTETKVETKKEETDEVAAEAETVTEAQEPVKAPKASKKK